MEQLKIKDNVDLKELEKFGFKYYENKTCDYPYYYARGLYVWIHNRSIKCYGVYDQSEKEYAILFDLIQAGLVEKVVGRLDFHPKNYYEIKEDEEFVAKNYDTRIEKFEPPFELEPGENYVFVSKQYGNTEIYRTFGQPETFSVTDERKDCGEIRYFNTYQEAVDYSHKLFNGE